MKYVGSKERHAKEMLTIMQPEIDKATYYIEPFVGGCGMMMHVKHQERLGYDSNKYIIEFWKQMRKNPKVLPDTLSEEQYYYLKDLPLEADWLIAFAGVGCSYSGKWFGGYARGKNNKGEPRNYCLEAKKRTLIKQPHIADVLFIHSDYRDIEIPENSFLYLDPPYQHTVKYKDVFNHDDFWEWVKNIDPSCTIYISEYQAPDWCQEVWSKKVNNTLDKNTGAKQGVEKLYKRTTHPNTAEVQ